MTHNHAKDQEMMVPILEDKEILTVLVEIGEDLSLPVWVKTILGILIIPTRAKEQDTMMDLILTDTEILRVPLETEEDLNSQVPIQTVLEL
jgi:hypothetical protein